MGKSNGANDRPSGIPWDEGSPRDPDYDYGDSVSVRAEERTEPLMTLGTLPFDPVVRMALIRKGILTPQDLKDAEDEIKVTSTQFNGG